MDDSLAQDLLAMWQSELTAMAADREVRESWAAFVALWAQSAHAAMKYLPYEHPPGSASTAQPARPPAAAAASQPGLGEVEQLNRRVAELEQILAELLARERGTGPGGTSGGI